MRFRPPRQWLVAAVTALAGLATLSATLSDSFGATVPAVAGNRPSATAGCGKAPTLASGPRSIQSGGKNRNFILRIPDNYDSNHPYRLIFGFHWVGGTANDVDSGGTSGYPWSYYGLRALSNNSAIFVAPQGLGNGWANSGGEDLAFVDSMIKQIEDDLCVDTTQLFSLGFSYGGGMSYAIACARATVFRAVAVYSGGQLSGCDGGTQPIAYIGLHGLRDPVLNISAGRSLRDRFARNNACPSQNPPEPAPGSLTHKTTNYSGCRAGYPVAWAAFDAGHTPNPWDGSAGDFNSGAQSWTREVVWNFFTQFDSATPPSSASPTPPSSASPTPPSSDFALRNGSSGRCLDVNDASQADGSPVIVWDCNSQVNQAWSATGSQELRVYGDKCLEVHGAATANGSPVIIGNCNGQSNQQWRINTDGTITAVGAGRCLDLADNGTANGTRVQIRDCNGAAGQRWSRG